MLKNGIFIFALLYCTLSQAQSDSINYSTGNRLNLKLAYVSSIIYPGISTGVEFRVNHTSKSVLKNQQLIRTFTKERYISGNLNWYHHPDFHDNIYLTAEWVMRRTRNDGFISEFSIGPGFSRTFLGGTTYKVDDNGSVSVIKLAGYYYALVTIGGGFGYNFSMKKQLPLSAFAKMNIISMFPYNSTVYFRPVLELGIRYTPGRTRSGIIKEPNTVSK
jgi:hypothetical protein